MAQLMRQLLLLCSCLFVLVGLAIADVQSDAQRDYMMARHHSSNTTFFEWIENGTGGKQYVALKFSAVENQDRTKWAECTYSVFYVDKEKKQSALMHFHVSTDDGSIKNLSVSLKSVSFDIDVGWFEHGGDTRKLRFVATRQGSSANSYQANAVALWKSMLDETKLIKIEWKQMPAITLPFATIGN